MTQKPDIDTLTPVQLDALITHLGARYRQLENRAALEQARMDTLQRRMVAHHAEEDRLAKRLGAAIRRQQDQQAAQDQQAFTDRELASILAGLRLLQDFGAHSRIDMSAAYDLASDHGNVDRLTPNEIDDLCERINQ